VSDCAPIALFVYNRPNHAEETLLALSENDLAQHSTLYIFCDGPKETADEKTFCKIQETRLIVKKSKWCREVIVIERDINFGLSGSIIDGVTKVINKHGKVIVLEDDIVTGKGFLKYMNDALDFYHNNEKVVCIHGYNFPISPSGLNETFFLSGADCWGWATWKRGWNIFDQDAEKLYQKIVSNGLTYDFDMQGAYPYTKMLKDQVEETINSWAIRWYASAFLAKKFTLYPRVSLVKNIGLDGSGTHEKGDKLYTDIFSNYCQVRKIPITHNVKVTRRIKKLFSEEVRLRFPKRLITYLRKF
jgi:hypothetical protein